MSQKKNRAWLEINEALRLDSCGQDEEALKKYLEGVQNLCSYIKDETNLTQLGESTRDDALKVIRSMKQSLSRVEDIISKLGTKNSKLPDRHSKTIEMTPTPVVVAQQYTEFQLFQETRKFSDLALKENARIQRVYQNRYKNIKDKSQRTTLGLELHRRMQENIAVAKSKEAQLKAEQAKKEALLLQLAARKLSMSCTSNETCSNHQSWSNEIALCACVMHYKYEENWVQEMNRQFHLKPSQFLVNTALERILDTPDHPLTCWLFGKQDNLKDRISSMLMQYLAHESRMTDFLECHDKNANGTDVLTLFDPLRNLTGGSMDPRSSMDIISKEICSILETFLRVFRVTLDLTEYSDYVDACYITVEQEFFKDLWPVASQLFRHVYKDEEAVFTLACRKLKNTSEYHADVAELAGFPSSKLDPLIEDLHRFADLCSPLAKLHSLVEIAHSLCNEDNSAKYEKFLSADDLIGLVSCLLVQSNLPQVLSELEAIEQMVPHRFLLGEEGYSLTTFQTAIKYLESQGNNC